MIRRWESWVVFYRAGTPVKEKRLRRHLTRRGAKRYAFAVTHNVDVILKALDVIRAGRRPAWPVPEVRRRETADPAATLTGA